MWRYSTEEPPTNIVETDKEIRTKAKVYDSNRNLRFQKQVWLKVFSLYKHNESQGKKCICSMEKPELAEAQSSFINPGGCKT